MNNYSRIFQKCWLTHDIASHFALLRKHECVHKKNTFMREGTSLFSLGITLNMWPSYWFSIYFEIPSFRFLSTGWVTSAPSTKIEKPFSFMAEFMHMKVSVLISVGASKLHFQYQQIVQYKFKEQQHLPFAMVYEPKWKCRSSCVPSDWATLSPFSVPNNKSLTLYFYSVAILERDKQIQKHKKVEQQMFEFNRKE